MLILGSDTQSRFFVQCAVTWINDFVVLILIFGDLIRKVQKRKLRASSLQGQSSEKKIQEAIQQYAQEAGSSDCASRGETNFVDYMSSVVKSFTQREDGELVESTNTPELTSSVGDQANGEDEEVTIHPFGANNHTDKEDI